MRTKATVLVTATGGIVSQGIMKSLKLSNMKKDHPVMYEIVATDINAQAAGLYRSDTGILMPPHSSSDYVDSIIKICKEQNVQAIFVGSSQELLPIAFAKEKIEKETGATVLINPIDVISIATDKWKTFEFLKKNNLPCAESSLPENQEEFIEEFGFPLVVKPREGHGSLHFYIVNDRDEIRQAISAIHKVGWRPILQEYLEGEKVEFTSGVVVNKTGKNVMASISMRRTLKQGQTYKAFVDDFHDVRRSAEETALKFGCRGSINIQAKMIENTPKIFEINPRFSATCPIRAVAGINEPDIVFRNFVLGEEIKIDAYQKLVCMRYWNEVYVPYSTYEKTNKMGKVSNSDSFIPDYF
ncbi:MAG TPA: ATP-grasp domain-containing protein [Nitrosopumilaceae archaeon]|nr:ATP-grasp domain-containing protein [Nitrosopumilaceae archaeon]